jgi:SAM-dependent methyltransferase
MKKILQTYRSLCTEYYDLHKPVLPMDEWLFYLQYAKNAQGPILEPMCGTGHFLIPLMQEGFAVEGFDASESMLARLLERGKDTGLTPCVWREFLEDLSVKNRYALAFIPVGSFNLVSDLEGVRKSLKALYDSLIAGGILVLELMTHSLAHHLEYNVWIDADYECADGKKIAVKTLYEPMIDGVVYVVRRYMLYNDRGEMQEVEIEEYALRFYTDQEILTLLKEAEFEKVKRVKAFQHGMLPELEDSLIVYECQK